MTAYGVFSMAVYSFCVKSMWYKSSIPGTFDLCLAIYETYLTYPLMMHYVLPGGVLFPSPPSQNRCSKTFPFIRVVPGLNLRLLTVLVYFVVFLNLYKRIPWW